MYHRHVCSKATFKDVDTAIFKMLWQWCKRRHPNKSRHRVADKYFTSVPNERGGRNWVFWGEIERANGEHRRMLLRRAFDVRIRRHIRILTGANPYDPSWANYFARRHSREEHRSKPAVGSDEYAMLKHRHSHANNRHTEKHRVLNRAL